MVSSSGVLTFSSNPGTAPAYGTVALPSANIPDSSVVDLGIQGTGTNDEIATKTFGTAPYRQHWVFFASYSDPNGFWSYWSIVLEETTNSIYVVEMRHHPSATISMSVGVQLDASTAMMVPGSPSLSNLTPTDDPTAVDNHYYEFRAGPQPAEDLSIKSLSLNPYLVLSNAPFTIGGGVLNAGSATVNTFDVNYQVDGGAVSTASYSVSGGLATMSTGTYSSSNQWTPVNFGGKSLKVWLDNVNGNPDGFPYDDTLHVDLTILAFETDRKVVIEEGTGTWCGWCPRGAVAMEYMIDNYESDFIGIAVHNGDPMTVTAYDNGAGIGSFPGMNVDRTLLGVGVSTATMEGYYFEQKAQLPVANVIIENQSLHSYSGEATVEVKAKFAADVSGDYRFALIVLEDDVTGNGSGFAQANYYSGGSNGNLSGAGFDWHLEANPVPASKMFYNHVGRKLVGGYGGVSGSVPATVAAGDSVSYTFTNNIANNVDDLNNVTFVVVLLNEDGEIVNADKAKASMILGMEEELAFEMTTFPNPTNGMVNVRLNTQSSGQVSLEVINLIGETVLANSNSMAPGIYTQTMDLSGLPKGVYNLRVTMDGVSKTERIILQ